MVGVVSCSVLLLGVVCGSIRCVVVVLLVCWVFVVLRVGSCLCVVMSELCCLCCVCCGGVWCCVVWCFMLLFCVVC